MNQYSVRKLDGSVPCYGVFNRHSALMGTFSDEILAAAHAEKLNRLAACSSPLEIAKVLSDMTPPEMRRDIPEDLRDALRPLYTHWHALVAEGYELGGIAGHAFAALHAGAGAFA